MAEAPKNAGRPRRSRHRRAVDRVSEVSFPVVMRGYDRQRVDRYVAEVTKLVTELEATQLRETVVQRAFDEVGEQTSGILQRARETADEIEAQSWSQAEGRLQRAEREADEVRREADRYAEELADDSRALWQERQRLIEEMRMLADEVLGVADDALERLTEPGVDPTLEDERELEEAEGAAGAEFGDEDTTVATIEELSEPGEASGNGSLETAGQPLEAGERPDETGGPLVDTGEPPDETGERPDDTEESPVETGEPPDETGEQPVETGEPAPADRD